MRNDELKPTRRFIFIIHHSAFIISGGSYVTGQGSAADLEGEAEALLPGGHAQGDVADAEVQRRRADGQELRERLRHLHGAVSESAPRRRAALPRSAASEHGPGDARVALHRL